MDCYEDKDNEKEVPVLRKSTPKILIVEDEQLVLWSLSLALSKAGFEINTVNSAEKAIFAIQSNRYDLVITDLNLPKGSGYTVASAVKQVSSATPVIITSAIKEMETNLSSSLSDVEAFIEKPYDLSQLTELVRQLLSMGSAKNE
ncbi:MAG: response regulator [Bacteroidetes bacterium]|nr:MAG: response regulator [Bacteroidota bacterium]